MFERLRTTAARLYGSRNDGKIETTIPGVTLTRVTSHQPFTFEIQGPLVGLVLQGTKRVSTGEHIFLTTAGDAMVASHRLPASAQIVEGTRSEPYLSVVLSVNEALLHELATNVNGAPPGVDAEVPVKTIPADPAIVDAFDRLLALAGAPTERKALAPLIVRELHFRFLTLPGGSPLNGLLSRDSRASRVARAVAMIRTQIGPSLPVPELAQAAGMGVSSFHAHFRAFTGMSPLTYQKELRLLRARDLLTDPEQSVSSVAYAVGYQSPTQFSREFSRKFGLSPAAHRDRSSREEPQV